MTRPLALSSWIECCWMAHLPEHWRRMTLRSVHAFGRTWDLVVERQGAHVRVTVEQDGKRVYDRTVAPENTVEIVLP